MPRKTLHGTSANTKRKYTANDIAHAKQLQEILKSADRICQAPKQWPLHFMRLRTIDKVSSKRILAALEWLAPNVKGKYTPLIFNAKSFRQKFERIEAAMRREPAAPLACAITQDAHWVVEHTGDLIYPTTAMKKEELRFIQISLNNYAEMLQKLCTLAKRLAVESRAADEKVFGKNSGKWRNTHWSDTRTAEWFVATLARPKDFAIGWTLEIHQHIWWLHENNHTEPKSLLRYAFHLDSKRYWKGFERELWQNYTDDETLLPRMIEMIRNEN